VPIVRNVSALSSIIEAGTPPQCEKRWAIATFCRSSDVEHTSETTTPMLASMLAAQVLVGLENYINLTTWFCKASDDRIDIRNVRATE